MAGKNEISQLSFRTRHYIERVIAPERGWVQKPLRSSIASITQALSQPGTARESTPPITRDEAILALAHTGRLLEHLHPHHGTHVSVDIENERVYASEGLFSLNFSWDQARVVSVGFIVDDKENIRILKSQRHKIDQTWRKEVETEEKKNGDRFIRNLLVETGLSIEAFGAVVGSLYLSDAMKRALPIWHGRIQFIEFEQQGKVRDLREKEMRETHMSPRLEAWYAAEVSKWRTHLDLPGMLERIGIKLHFKNERGFHTIEPSVLKNAFESHFTDDKAYPNRFAYRQLFYELVNP